jgi:predicted DNA-binding protein (MmcQ/YjbR family)
MKKNVQQTKKSTRAARPTKSPAKGSVTATLAKNAPLSAAERALRETGLGWPEVTEHFPWGHRTLKVAGKAFVFIGGDETAWRASVKLPNTGMMALALPFAAPTGYGMGKSGWVTASFAPDEEPPIPLLLDWLRESYQAVAPARLKKALDQEAATAPTGASKPRRSSAKATPAVQPAAVKKPRSGTRRATAPGASGRRGATAAAAATSANTSAKRKRTSTAIAGSGNSG